MMRKAITFALVLFGASAGLAACGGAGSPASPAPAAPALITEVRILRSPSGWGTGRAYEAILRRDGTASFKGEQEVDRIGRFTAILPAATFDSLAQVIVQTPLFDPPAVTSGRPDVCLDARKVSITAVRGGVRYTAKDDCERQDFERQYLAPVDTVVAHLQWH